MELCDSLNLANCICCFRRFAARRGVPEVVYSDQAATFKDAAIQLQKHYGIHAPKWRFIVPRSPWWGGWWERMVRSTKSALRKTVGKRCLSRMELETTLTEIEAAINSRPLTQLSEDPNVEGPLTPQHFLQVHYAKPFAPDHELPNLSKLQLQDMHTSQIQSLDHFWDRWLKEYITNLPPLIKNHKEGGLVEVGEIVLIRDEPRKPRLQWPLGRISQVHRGPDGRVRCVTLRTATGELMRPIQRLHKLEVHRAPKDEDGEHLTTIGTDAEGHNEDMVTDEVQEANTSSTRVYTQYGRESKPTQRFSM